MNRLRRLVLSLGAVAAFLGAAGAALAGARSQELRDALDPLCGLALIPHDE